jgi:hypothetical protein
MLAKCQPISETNEESLTILPLDGARRRVGGSGLKANGNLAPRIS